MIANFNAMFRRQSLNARALLVALTLFGVAIWAAAASADVLELRTGEIVQGKFLGGSPLNIRFQVNGQEQVFSTKDILNIGFSDADTNSGPGPSVSPAASNGDASTASQQPPPDVAPPSDNAAAPGNTPDTGSLQNSPNSPVLIPAGTSVMVRMIDSVDSSTGRIGDTFRASLESALVVGETVIAPKGADAYGKLTQAKDAGKISGSPELTLELTGIRINGTVVALDSTDYNVAGKSRGKQSAQRIGGAAVVGAILGGILGGPKGAAIGATVGAGGGTAVQVTTHGDRVRVPSETLLEFRLQQDVPTGNPPAN